MSTAAQQRLAEERKNWRKDRPFGFVAKPATAADGSINLMKWECSIPGKEGTPWEGGQYPVTLTFPPEYPSKAPKASFPPGFFHVNVYPDGKVCLSILDDDPDIGGQWAPSITLRQILTGIQSLLTDPNAMSPAQEEAYKQYKADRAAYDRRVRKQALMYKQDE